MKALHIMPVMLFSLAIPLASAGTFEVQLKINDGNSSLYIPGMGEQPAYEVSSNNYLTPPHFYISSHDGNILRGLVSLYGSPFSIGIEKSSGKHIIKLKQYSNSSTLLVFSKGSWKDIENRMRDVERGAFMSYTEPSFAFGLGAGYILKMVLSYPAIDIVGDMVLQKGLHRLKIENLGAEGDRLKVGISK